jgi:hypothetical protein
MTPTEKMVCELIDGSAADCGVADEARFAQVVESACRHGIHLVLIDRLKKSSIWERCSADLRERLGSIALAAAAVHLIHEHELRKVLLRLHANGIRPILMKGASLAYTVYRSPMLRPRSDTDLLIGKRDLASAVRILTELGYHGPEIQTNNLTSYQCLYRKKIDSGPDHKLDLHWKINNAQLFAKALPFEEISTEAIELPRLAFCALGLAHRHSLLLACVHRFGHAHAPFYNQGEAVYAGDHLRWVYDIHLLCSALKSAQWAEFVTLVKAKCVAGFCVDGLTAAKDAFRAQIPAETMEGLRAGARAEAVNIEKLRSSGAAWFLANLRALPSLRQRLAFLQQVAFPPIEYMMNKYDPVSQLSLPILYAQRSINGVLKMIGLAKKRSKCYEK